MTAATNLLFKPEKSWQSPFNPGSPEQPNSSITINYPLLPVLFPEPEHL